jgi:hypothetical protein
MITVLWDVTLRSLVCRHRHFVGICCLHLQDTRFLLVLWRWRHRWKKGRIIWTRSIISKCRRPVCTDMSEAGAQDSHKRPAGGYRIVRTGYPSTVSVSTRDRARGTQQYLSDSSRLQGTEFINLMTPDGRLQWPRGLRHELSSPARSLGSWVRIPLKAWMFVCAYSVFV